MVCLIYTASIAYMIILSQHLVPRDSESLAAPPPNFAFWGDGKKIFGADPVPQNFHQVSANAGFNERVTFKTILVDMKSSTVDVSLFAKGYQNNINLESNLSPQ